MSQESQDANKKRRWANSGLRRETGEGNDENPIEYATPSYLMFARESRTVNDVTHDAQSIVNTENFVAEATPKLLRMADALNDTGFQFPVAPIRRRGRPRKNPVIQPQLRVATLGLKGRL
jgi:hypothetical protein